MQDESKLMEIVKLIGSDVLHDEQKLVLEVAKTIRLGILQQNAFHKDDTYVPLEKQFDMMELVLYLNDKAKEVVSKQIPFSRLTETHIFEDVIRMKYDIANNELYKFDEYKQKIDDICRRVVKENI